MKIIGIDASISGTASCVYDTETEKYFFYTYTSHTDFDFEYENEKIKIKVEKQENFKNLDSFERYIKIADKNWSEIALELSETNFFFLEDYALKGIGKVFQIAEYTAILKRHIYDSGNSIENTFPPMSIKKEIGGKGNLDKFEIYCDTWRDYDLRDMIEDLENEGIEYSPGCWQEDILDSYAVMKMGLKSLHF